MVHFPPATGIPLTRDYSFYRIFFCLSFFSFSLVSRKAQPHDWFHSRALSHPWELLSYPEDKLEGFNFVIDQRVFHLMKGNGYFMLISQKFYCLWAAGTEAGFGFLFVVHTWTVWKSDSPAGCTMSVKYLLPWTVSEPMALRLFKLWHSTDWQIFTWKVEFNFCLL